MRKIRTWKMLNSFFAGLVAGALIVSAIPAGGADASALRAELREIPPPQTGPASGHYCRVPDRGTYFLERDFNDQISTYAGFTRWCWQRGGALGWTGVPAQPR